MNKIEAHQSVCEELNGLYERKNHDYGDSFGKSFLEYGMAMPCIRLEDKLNRLKALTKTDAEVMDETIDDTLMDLANYAIMTLVERRVDLVDICHYKTMYFPGSDVCARCEYFSRAEGPNVRLCQTCPWRDTMIEKKVKC